MRRATTSAERLNSARALLGAFSGLLAVAQLKQSTTRRTVTLLGELLAEQDRADLHEAALSLMGSAQLSVADVQALHTQIISAFDHAVAVNRTPMPYGFTIQPHLRPYYVEATQELIDEGHHREAVYWIACLDRIYFVLQKYAPDAEKPGFAAQLHALYVTLGYTANAVWAERGAMRPSSSAAGHPRCISTRSVVIRPGSDMPVSGRCRWRGVQRGRQSLRATRWSSGGGRSVGKCCDPCSLRGPARAWISSACVWDWRSSRVRWTFTPASGVPCCGLSMPSTSGWRRQAGRSMRTRRWSLGKASRALLGSGTSTG